MTDPTVAHLALVEAVADGVPALIGGATDADGTVFIDAVGERAPGDPTSTDDVIALYSVTKAFTATAALQCVEDGLIDLDAPARDILPEIGDLRVLERLDDDGTLHTRPPVREITPRMLLLHTAGLGYEFFDPTYAALARRRTPSDRPLWDSLQTPLLHEPGELWTYGTGMDWLGLVIERARGKRLEEVFREGIYAPCGMESTSFDLTPEMAARAIVPHRRTRSGEVVALPAPAPGTPELDMGGQGLWSSVPDLLALLRVWLGDGSAPGGQVLRPETLAWAVQGDPDVVVRPLSSSIEALAHSADFYPGLRTSWAYSFLRLDEDEPGGRRAGTLSWGGLGNVHYWIDRETGVAGVFAAQLLPWLDPACARGFAGFEAAVYG